MSDKQQNSDSGCACCHPLLLSPSLLLLQQQQQLQLRLLPLLQLILMYRDCCICY